VEDKLQIAIPIRRDQLWTVAMYGFPCEDAKSFLPNSHNGLWKFYKLL
jgi:hypothetical protein